MAVPIAIGMVDAKNRDVFRVKVTKENAQVAVPIAIGMVDAEDRDVFEVKATQRKCPGGGIGRRVGLKHQ